VTSPDVRQHAGSAPADPATRPAAPPETAATAGAAGTPGTAGTAGAETAGRSAAVDSPFARRADDRDAAPQFVLPLVVRIERDAPPARTDALQTAARAVLTLLTDERATAVDGPWTAAVRDWQDARIRKVVRRARGAEWRRVQALPGITLGGPDGAVPDGGGAQVRVFPPVPLDGWPKDLARLQVSGTELDDPEPLPPAEPGLPVLWLNPGVTMSAGKAMAQTGHGAQLAWWELDEAARQAWRADGFRLAVRTASAELWRELAGSGLPLVRDAGFTEVAPGSATVVADHPALRRR
jgi:peptidyl-tRNA hydrolase